MGGKGLLRQAIYRLRQFQRAYTDSPEPQALACAEKTLSPELFALFLQMLPFEQAHALRVFEALQSIGVDDTVLLTAGLLHDVGKARCPLNPWQRGIAVLLKRLSPGAYQKIGAQEALTGWRAGVVVAVQHPRWGAEMAANAGADEMVQALILHHQDVRPTTIDAELQPLLKLLQKVDEVN